MSNPPEVIHTEQYRELVHAFMNNLLFLFWFNALVMWAPGLEESRAEEDPGREEARQHLLKVQREFYEHVPDGDYTKIWNEISVTRRLDIFLYYISQMLLQVFLQRPEMLKSDKLVKVREVLEAGSLEEFTRRLADNLVTELSFKGFRQLIAYLNDNFKLGFNTGSREYKSVVEFIEVRNIIVHNQGRVSALFLQRTDRPDLQVGDVYPLTTDYITQAGNDLLEIAERLDTQFVKHFNLHYMGKPREG